MDSRSCGISGALDHDGSHPKETKQSALQRIPTSIPEWKHALKNNDLQGTDKCLNNIHAERKKTNSRSAQGFPDLQANRGSSKPPSLSGSTMKFEEFLFLRAIWRNLHHDSKTSTIKYLNEVGLTSNDSHRRALHKLAVRNGQPGSFDEKVTSSTVDNSSDGTPCTPANELKLHTPDKPRRQKDVVGSHLNDELCSLTQASKALVSHTWSIQHDAMPRLGEPDALKAFWGAYSFFHMICVPKSELNETQMIGGIRSWTTALDRPNTSITPTASPSNIFSKAPPDHTPTHFQGISELELPVAHSLPPMDDEMHSCKDETAVTGYAVTLFNTLSPFITNSHDWHVMRADRQTFYCAPRDSHYSGRYFRADVDAVVLSKESRETNTSVEKYMMICEFKKDSYDRVSGRIELQETAEAAAYIAARQSDLGRARSTLNDARERLDPSSFGAGCLGQSNGANGGAVLMMTQCRTDVLLTLARYTSSWVEYILDGNKSVALTEFEDEASMLTMERIGKFSMENPESVEEFVVVLAALIIEDNKHAT